MAASRSDNRLPESLSTRIPNKNCIGVARNGLTQDAVKRPSAVHAEYCWAIETALGRHGIEIPFPQRDLNVRSWFGRRDAEGLEAVEALAGTVPSAAAGGAA